MALVIDASALMPLPLADESGDYAEAVIAALAEQPGHVPSLFWFEVRNGLVVNERRGRITADVTAFFLASLADLPIQVEPVPTESTVLDLARRYDLSVYDAAYLDLAIRTGSALASLDQKLVAAAKSSGVKIFGEGPLP